MDKQFRNEITYNNIFFRYAKVKSTTEGTEFHNFHEILYFMGGENTTFISENFQQILQPGTLVLIPKERYHFLRFEDPDNYTRLLMNFGDIPELEPLNRLVFSEIKFLHDIKPRILHILERMCTLLRNDTENPAVQTALYGYFQSLVAELSMTDIESNVPETLDHDPLIAECIRYINENFTTKFTIETMATKLGLSPSTLFHEFKKVMGISIHQFVTEKRLVYAQKLLFENNMATKIYADCGFSDYSSFYKAYQKMFGHPPSTDKRER